MQMLASCSRAASWEVFARIGFRDLGRIGKKDVGRRPKRLKALGKNLGLRGKASIP